MNRFTKLAAGAGAAALAAMTAAPAQAQYYPYPQQGGVEEIVRGVAVAGAVSAVVGAIANATRGATGGYGYPQGGYGYPTTGYPQTGYPQGGYGYPSSGYPQGGYGYPSTGYPAGGYGYPNQGYAYGAQNFQQAAVSACSAQAQRYGRVSVDNIELRGRSTMRVRGMTEASAGYSQAGYGNYGARVERRTFDCSFNSSGRITNFDTGRVRY